MKTLVKLLVCFLTFNLNAQSYEDILEKPDMNFANGEKFYKGKIIIVVGENCDSIEFYRKTIDRMRRYDSLAQVKKESELSKDDFNKNLYFYGLLDWYINLNKYDLPILKTDNGFTIGQYTFDDKLDAIWLVNSDETRQFSIGNSYDAFQDRGDWGAYDYMIIRNGKRIHWGNLTNNKFDSKHHINSLTARPHMLNKTVKFDCLNIHYPDNLIDSSYYEKLKDIKKSLDIIINLLDLQRPDYIIESYIYKDVNQKTMLSCHDGYGVSYPEWKEINVIFNNEGNKNVLIHESIHILFDNEMKNMDNSCLLGEGIVGYAMYSLDSTKIKSDNEKSMLYFNEPIEKWFDERVYSGNEIQPSKLYPISAAWTRFLIDNYGLRKFKDLYKIPYTKLQYGACEKIYGKTIGELTDEFKEFIKN